jgi:cellulose synthase/poly-beta-1,6-N-acetylglucosamine synthase-like glycosyltransferase
MTGAIRDLLVGFDWFVLVYFVALNSVYLLLVAIAAVDVAGTMRRHGFSGQDDLFANPFTPGVSVLVPAHNEEIVIVDSVRALLSLRYPEFEVIVVDDGSTDGTFDRLSEAFGLVETSRVIPPIVPTMGQVLSAHAASNGDPLLVIRKENAGRRSDPLNVGINAAQHPLVCMVDADSILDPDALLRVAKPFVDDPERTVASGGVIRAVNGCVVERGRIAEPRMPTGWLARIQVLEYLRSFLLGRTGWSRLGGLLIISGAFGLFRRDLVLEVGGLDLNCIGEDAELVTRIHHHLRTRRTRYRIVFVAEPVSWTEVPSTTTTLARQRRRWSLGLAQVLRKHRAMIGNPRYGRIGLVVLPYYLVFELLGPIVELFGVLAVALGFAFGLLNVQFAILFALFAIGYGVFLSVAALAIEEFSFHRYHRWKDLGVGIAAALLENLGYRQLHALWRLRGLIDATRRREVGWGAMTRAGFTTATPEAE